MGGTCGLGIVSSVVDVLWMSVISGMRGVGGVCDMFMYLAQGGVDGEWMRGLGLGFTQCSILLHLIFHLLPNMYLFIADITNPESFVLCCWAWICLEINRFYEDQRQPSSGSV